MDKKISANIDTDSSALFTILMPVFNASKFLPDAIESILNQSEGNFEFLIINDGSTDDSLNIINKYAKQDHRIRVITRKNKGLVATLNEGINSATTNLIARMDADDISTPERMKRQYDFMINNPKYSVVGCRVQVIDESGNVSTADPRPVDDHGLKLFLGYGCAIGSPTMMFRKDIVEDVGGFNEGAWPAEDYEWLTRIIKLHPQTKFYLIPDTLYKYRENTKGISFTNRLAQAKKTIEIGDKYRNTILDDGWSFITWTSHKQWFNQLDELNEHEGKDRLKVIYYTVQSWFINDQKKKNMLKAYINRTKLKLCTILINPGDYHLVFNQPRAHSLPNKEE